MISVTSDNSAYFYRLRVQFVGFMNIFTSLLSKSTKRQNGMYNKFLVSCFKRYLGKIQKCMNVSAGCFGQFPKLLKNLPVLHPVCSIISLTSDEAAFFTEEEGTFYPGKCYSCKGCFLITVSLKKKEEWTKVKSISWVNSENDILYLSLLEGPR